MQSPLRLCMVTFAFLFMANLGHQASAQSDSELRRLNEQLTAQLQNVQAELDQAEHENAVLQDRITALEQQIANMRRAGSNRPTTQPEPEPEKVTVDESVPLNSPRALFRALGASLETAMKDTDPGKAGDSKRRAYIKKLENWASNAQRQHRGPIVWHVRVVDGRPGPRFGERIVTLRPVDPETDVALGDNFEVLLSRTLSDRLAHDEQRGELGLLVLRGTLEPQININELRTERGSFDNPPYLGMFTEFGYLIDVKSIMSVDEDKMREGAATRPADTRPGNPSR